MLQELSQALTEELALMRQLCHLLRQEQQALTERRLDDLSTLLENKAALLKALDSAGQARRAFFSSEQVLDSSETIRNWFSTYQPALLTTWGQLIDCTREADLLNRTNGQLISNRQEIEAQFLQQLLQTGQHDESAAYSADGKLSNTPGSGRHRGSA
ncbi:flagella synthesis protein FlgN [Chitinilyticum piscinae]|uniref:Flagellar protein FlgN n=1 Tax=Chitinilyticum piscinae TaxID=2866724 RepID=A0A8J7FIK1_9NEIS|nr:flagellar protein FlgN [Chitinilyticum piscinae]MBE9608835.1 flagellar protein FlgN [Chitinilyticum piscinae]